MLASCALTGIRTLRMQNSSSHQDTATVLVFVGEITRAGISVSVVYEGVMGKMYFEECRLGEFGSH